MDDSRRAFKIPRGQGIWPAFWMLGTDIDKPGWPHCGEFDIMENIGKEPTIVHGTIHAPGYSGGNAISAPYPLPNDQRFADDFHLFSVEWEPNVIRFYVDDHLYATRTPADLPKGTKWVYEHPFFLCSTSRWAAGGRVVRTRPPSSRRPCWWIMCERMSVRTLLAGVRLNTNSTSVCPVASK
jgi:beta-glucanase (GH16 family)